MAIAETDKLALAKTSIVDLVQQRVQAFMEHGELQLPADYSAANALKSAWLTLQDTLTRDKKPVLTTCDRNSIANALLDMVVQGLNPAKDQCYFIAYGAQLTCQRSYFGTMAVAKMVDPTVEDIVAEVVYEGDTLTYKIERGKKIITAHEQSLENMEGGVIRGAYCTIYYRDGHETTEIMSLSQIHQAWKQSSMNPFDEKGQLKPTSTHAKFPAEMAKKTVINRTCKPIINSSSDATILQVALRRTEEVRTDYAVENAIAEHANQELIDVESVPVEDAPADEAERATPTPKTEQPRLVPDDGPGF